MGRKDSARSLVAKCRCNLKEFKITKTDLSMAYITQKIAFDFERLLALGLINTEEAMKVLRYYNEYLNKNKSN
jgi:hypothetical protein